MASANILSVFVSSSVSSAGVDVPDLPSVTVIDLSAVDAKYTSQRFLSFRTAQLVDGGKERLEERVCRVVVRRIVGNVWSAITHLDCQITSRNSGQLWKGKKNEDLMESEYVHTLDSRSTAR
ncbi:hypothetical protein EDC04DRAFT_2776493 [Pisolithus marmoratus]|nr:hypothetical protein EDC04DRAFT_2776493 [Pisolithus marmoratus]